MGLEQVVSSDFVLLEASWPVEKARRRMRSIGSGHVIVYRNENGREYYYLFPRDQAEGLLGAVPDDMTVGRALDLHEWRADPAVDVSEPPQAVPSRSIVLRDGRLLGFLAPPTARRGAGTRGEPIAGAPPAPSPRSLVADFPETVVVGQRASLLVSLTAPLAEPSARALTVELARGAAVDVLVQPRRGFVVEGADSARLEVLDRDDEALFTLRPTGVGPGEIRVLAFHQGQRLGAITLAPTIVAAAPPEGDAVRRSRSEPLAEARDRAADLTLLIFERREGGETVLDLRLNCRDPALRFNFKRFGPIRLQTDAARYFADFFRDIEDLPIETEPQRAAAAKRLSSKGTHLFETLFPQELQRELWAVRERIASIQVQSEEPWIPWELCRLSGEENGAVVEGPFLCEAYEITRWIQDLPLQTELTLSNLAVVVPTDSGLSFAESELRYLLSLADGKRAVRRVPARAEELSEALASGAYDGWHFTGHGAAGAENPDRSTMSLEDGDSFTPQELSGRLRNLGRGRPLVFLNACQLGRGGLALTGVGGWANRFLQAGAAAFVGAHWSVSDEPAFGFMRALYERLLRGTPIGQAAREARLAVRQSSDPTTWLAYTVFAEPYAAVASPRDG
jgi:hypothetical protein